MNSSTARLHSAIEAIYDAAPEPANWPQALDKIVGCFDDVGAILQWRKDDGTFGTIATESLMGAQQDYIEGGWSQRDIKANRAIERGYFFNGTPFCDRHVCSEDELRSDPFCATFLTKHGLGWFGAVAVSPHPQIGVLLSIQRDLKKKQQYSDDELDSLAHLGRHVEKSLRLSIRLLETRATNLAVGEALARIDVGVFALDSGGRLLFANSSGQRLVGNVLELVDDHLRIRHRPSQNAFEGEIARTTVSDSHDLTSRSKPIIVQSRSSKQRWVFYVLPIAGPSNLTEEFLTRTRAIVLAVEQKIGEPADPALVRDVFGLTLGEARVAALVGSGVALEDTAARLGVGKETVRTMLKSVFRKLGVSRQAELVALLARMMLS
ncbi:helix-turn-helix transcriptional regulator [Bradyrhizobium sp. OAE829]|uniref:helix-turn-helix transcriptional regulator n=1 Tax=Bradyrhizobium sp. OAE829 TaxID=2663807 RepID=UPI00178BE8DB